MLSLPGPLYATDFDANQVIIANGFFKLPINPYLFCVWSIIPILSDLRYCLIISLTDSEIFCEVGNFLPTLAVWFVIDSLDTKFKVNISFSASTVTFVIEPT